jgi:nicotinate-nucleotide pyrophosphorylase
MTLAPSTIGIQAPDLGADIARWLAEDVGDGDRTTEAIVAPEARTSATLVLRESGVVAGLDLARQVFLALDEDLRWVTLAVDGDRVTAGPVARVHVTRRMPFGFHANWFGAAD